ncbi:Cellobionic acid phosphorylase [Thalassocella blandensis]|nr:Cellobionic acid phosphorylase [Thalassocella blandensis]
MIKISDNGAFCTLYSPTAMPNACGFLWNKQMMIQVSCRGHAIAQHMQPEPSKYTYQPVVEGKIFMLPEQPFFANSPGRFFFIKDEETGQYFSAPFEPTRVVPDTFEFTIGKTEIQWKVQHLGIRVHITLSLPKEDTVELWQIRLKNLSGKPRKISFYPYIPFGFMSWMNQSARYREDLGAIVGHYITPYQKLEDYFRNKHLKDLTFFLHDKPPQAYEACREAFEGEGGVQHPSAIAATSLSNGDALYESPCAALQYKLKLADDEQTSFRFLLGPALNDDEIIAIRQKYFADQNFQKARSDYAQYIAESQGVLQVTTEDQHFNYFVNHWLARQVFYHGDVNRLATDPQTRNYLQDNMGMAYIQPDTCKKALQWALAQQKESGAMPDGILLNDNAELKYINQIPHTDHCIWLPLCMEAYLHETNDYAFLSEYVNNWKPDGESKADTVSGRISRAMRWLLQDRDARGLNFIAQGDWNDPMNMVGYKGKGVSGWLSIATIYALKVWASICERQGLKNDASEFQEAAQQMEHCVQQHLWDGNWFARGITDDDIVFGVRHDSEGKIYLNPQSWALMAGICDTQQTQKILQAIDQQLATPFGPMMLAPAYTKMREDVGRMTQKHPGAAENGSVYNHAAAFYAWGLCRAGETDRAFDVIRQMIAGPDHNDYLQRGQLPVFIPNYYRGAYYQFPRTAGRSSQLFNTGTVAWVYRTLIEGIFGLKGHPEGLQITPSLPSNWQTLKVTRKFRDADFVVRYEKVTQVAQGGIWLNDEKINGTVIRNITPKKTYHVLVRFT